MLDTEIDDSFTAGQHFSSTAGYTLRVACVLAGRDIPDLPKAISPRLAVARATLGAMKPAEFAGAEPRIIPHIAGFSNLEQTDRNFACLYGFLNFYSI